MMRPCRGNSKLQLPSSLPESLTGKIERCVWRIVVPDCVRLRQFRSRCARMIGNFCRQIGREISGVLLLHFRALPILARQGFATVARTAIAFDEVIVILGHLL